MAIRAFQRIGAHSHVKGLGLDGLKAKPVADGMIGQEEAREAAGLIVTMIKEGRMAGRSILLAGPPGTGKTALAVAIAKELGIDVPFVSLSASEVYSSERKKTEVLMEALRKAIGVRIHEFRKVYEGEVTGLELKVTKHPYNPYQQVPESAKLNLATKSETKIFTVGQQIATSIINQNIRAGDIIQIDAESGRVIKLGRSEEAAGEKYDIEPESKIPRPHGSIEKEKEFVYTLTLQDLDEMQARSGGGIFGLLFGGGERAEIDPGIRQRVDEEVKSLVEEKRAEILPGVLFIDEVAMLDIECFAFLTRAMESELSPVIILATNRGITKIRGTDIESPHGMPLDMLDRLLIINTEPYGYNEILEILKIRVREEGIEIAPETLEFVAKIGVDSSLRYAVQILTPAAQIAKAKGKKIITNEEIEEAKKLFADLKRSVLYLKEYESKLLA
ncbi:MAG: RuvB-like domain-containing protein [Candidatus Bathyarchaeia archaeon]